MDLEIDFEIAAKRFCKQGPISFETLAEKFQEFYERGFADGLSETLTEFYEEAVHEV